MSILQRLHDSEINASIASFFDQLWTAKIGDEMNGYAAEETGLRSYREAEVWLERTACALYPKSAFATGKPPAGYVGPKARETASALVYLLSNPDASGYAAMSPIVNGGPDENVSFLGQLSSQNGAV